MAKRKLAKNAATSDKGCLPLSRKYIRYIFLIFGACCIISFVLALFAPSEDASSIPTLQVLPTSTVLLDTNSTDEPFATIGLGDSLASETIVADAQVALTSSQMPLAFSTSISATMIATSTPSPDNRAVLAPIFASATAAMVQVRAMQHATTSVGIVPTARPEATLLQQWLEEQPGVDIVQLVSVDGSDSLVFYAEVIVYPSYNTLSFAESYATATQYLTSGRSVGEIAIVISDGEQAIDYTMTPLSGDWRITTLTLVDPPTPRPNNFTASSSMSSSNSTNGTTMYAETADVRIRTCPQGGSGGCEVIAVLSAGQAVTTYGTVEGSAYDNSTLWYETVYNGRDGYVHSRLVQSSPPVIAVQPAINMSGNVNSPLGGGTGVQTSNVRPDNCSEAVAMGLTAQQAAQWSHLDRDGDGVACYGD